MKISRFLFSTMIILCICFILSLSNTSESESLSDASKLESSQQPYSGTLYMDGSFVDPNECQIYYEDDGSYFINFDKNAPTLEEAFSDEELKAYQSVIDAMIEASETNPNRPR